MQSEKIWVIQAFGRPRHASLVLPWHAEETHQLFCCSLCTLLASCLSLYARWAASTLLFPWESAAAAASVPASAWSGLRSRTEKFTVAAKGDTKICFLASPSSLSWSLVAMETVGSLAQESCLFSLSSLGGQLTCELASVCVCV